MTPDDIRTRVYDLPLNQSLRLRTETRTARHKLVDPEMADDFSDGIESDFIDMRHLVVGQAERDTVIPKEETA
jgi:hypothetical protein